jgi:hypothetical protein
MKQKIDKHYFINEVCVFCGLQREIITDGKFTVIKYYKGGNSYKKEPKCHGEGSVKIRRMLKKF